MTRADDRVVRVDDERVTTRRDPVVMDEDVRSSR
jgi:hypothetical protein